MEHAYQRRVGSLRKSMAESGVAALLVTHLPNVFYLCGFSGSSGALLIEPSGATLFTDGRYRQQSREEVRGARVRNTRQGLAMEIGRFIRGRGRRISAAFEVDRVTVAQLAELRKTAGPSIRWVGRQGLVENLRSRKDEREVAAMRGAAALGGRVFQEVLPLIRPGVEELELAAEIEHRMKRYGAERTAFETIVASGPRAALVHARPTAKPLRRNELVVLDLGAILRGYCCDITRTVYLGSAPAEIRRWYRAVLDAQRAAQDTLRGGVTGEEVDGAARRVLRRAGLGRYFVHSTGHGLGLEVHEAPRLARGQKEPVPEGSVVTLEPGIYVPGRGGIRVEDDVLVLADGAELLTTAPREFIEL